MSSLIEVMTTWNINGTHQKSVLRTNDPVLAEKKHDDHSTVRGGIIPHICHFFTQAIFLENKIYTEKRVNYDKLHSILPILRVNYDKLHSKLPIFHVKSVTIYTGQKKFTRAPPVAPVTNIWYGRLKSF